jgi:hypothetical protein
MLLTDVVVVSTRVCGDNSRVPLTPVDDEGVRRTRDLLLRLLWGSRVRGLILGVETDFRRGDVFGEDRAAILDRGSHDVVGKNVDAQVDLADGGLEVLSEVRAAKN